MKKIFFFLLIFVSICLSASEIIKISSNDYLINREFKYNCVICSSELKFFKNNRYRIEFGIEGDNYWYNEGLYEIKDGKALLHPDKCLENENGNKKDCSKTMGEAACYLEKNDKSLEYSTYLVCKSDNYKKVIVENTDRIEYPVLDSQLAAGEKRIINNIPVIIMGKLKGIITANVKIRTAPSINAQAITYQKELYGDPGTPFVPEKTGVIIIARTLKKEKVQNWENYWYYIQAGTSDGAWMFGEFVKISEKK